MTSTKIKICQSPFGDFAADSLKNESVSVQELYSNKKRNNDVKSPVLFINRKDFNSISALAPIYECCARQMVSDHLWVIVDSQNAEA